MAQQGEQQKALESATASIRASLLMGIQRTQADMQIARNVGKHLDGTKMNRYESGLMAFWRGKPEHDAVRVMGHPGFNRTGAEWSLR